MILITKIGAMSGFENHIPKRVLISIFVTSEDETEESVIYSRIFNIPVAESMDQPLSAPTTVNTTAQNDNAGNLTINVGAPPTMKIYHLHQKTRCRSGISLGTHILALIVGSFSK